MEQNNSVPFCDVAVNSTDPLVAVREIVRHLYPGFQRLQNPIEQLDIKVLAGGFINKMFLVIVQDDQIIVRVYTESLKKMFNREQELSYLLFLHERGLYEKIYGTFRNGICYHYRRGRCLLTEEMSEPKMTERIVNKLAHLHAASTLFPGPKKRMIAQKIRDYWEKLPDVFSDPETDKQIREFFPNMPALRKECFELLSIIESLTVSGPLVLCHYDLIGANVIYDEKEDSVHFIDFEFAEFGYQADEIGHFCTELAGTDVNNIDNTKYPDISFQLEWIRMYLHAWNRFSGRTPSLVPEDEVWNLYVLSNKFALLRRWFCFTFVLSVIAEKEPSHVCDKVLEDVDDLKFAKNMINGYYARKDMALALKPRSIMAPTLDLIVDLSVDPLPQIHEIYRNLRPEVQEPLKIKMLSGGYVNQMYQISTDHNPVDAALMRIHTPMMKNLFNRDQEFEYLEFLSEHGLYGKIYGRFQNGLVYEYRHGRPLKLGEMSDPKLSRIMAQKLAELHAKSLSLPGSKSRSMVAKVRDFLKRFPPTYVDPVAERLVNELFPNLHELSDEFETLVDHCTDLGAGQPLVLCHHDLQPYNLIYDEVQDVIHIIDYEFAGIGYQAEDIGNHFSEFIGIGSWIDFANYPSKEFQLTWIRNYLEAWHELTGNKYPVSDSDVWNMYVRASKFVLMKYIFVTCFLLNQERDNPNYQELVDKLEFDSLNYARKICDGYFLQKEFALSLQLHPE